MSARPGEQTSPPPAPLPPLIAIARPRRSLPIYTPPRAAAGVDVLRWPVVGRFLRWRHARPALQLGLLAAAIVIVLHGLLGPQLAPKNLATVGIWVHYRGLLVLVLVAAGNFFCAGCPMVMVRDLARRIRMPTWQWPLRLRTKWIALGLLIAVLFGYELFDLWAHPAATAWLVLIYFAAALLVDLLFKGAVFCKHLCPVGQYNFIASTLSPVEVRVKDAAVCRRCDTHDCIKGTPGAGPAGRGGQRGCELGLFLPRKVGNLDCTLCMDCVHACPHDNIMLGARVPGAELVEAGKRSSLGRLAKRRDLAALAVVFAFAALLNALGMVGPVYALERFLAAALGARSEAPVLAVMFLAGLVLAPAVLLGAASLATRALAGPATGATGSAAVRFAYCLVPLGFAVWLGHYGFHLSTGLLTVVPVMQSAVAAACGWPILGQPRWGWSGLQPGAFYPIEMGLLLIGAIGSVAVARWIAERDYRGRAGRAALPWVLVIVAMAGAAAWLLSQPMEMRGTDLGGLR